MKCFIIFGLFLIWQVFGSESEWKWENEVLDGSLIQIYTKVKEEGKDVETEMYLNTDDSFESLIAVENVKQGYFSYIGKAKWEDFLTTYRVVYSSPKTFKLKVEHIETLNVLQNHYREIFPYGQCAHESYKNARNIFPDIKLMEYCKLAFDCSITADNWMFPSSDLKKEEDFINIILKYIEGLPKEDSLVATRPMLQDIRELLKFKKEKQGDQAHWNKLLEINKKNQKLELKEDDPTTTLQESYKKLSWDILQQVEINAFPQKFRKYANYKAFHKVLIAYDNGASKDFLLKIFGNYLSDEPVVNPEDKWFGTDSPQLSKRNKALNSYRGKTKIVPKDEALEFNIPDKKTGFALNFNGKDHNKGLLYKGNPRFVYPTGDMNTYKIGEKLEDREHWHLKVVVLVEECDEGDDYNFDFTSRTAVPVNSIVEIYRPYDHAFERFEALDSKQEAQQCLGIEEIDQATRKQILAGNSEPLPNRCTAKGAKCIYKTESAEVKTATCNINVDRSVWKNSFGEDIWYQHNLAASYFVEKTENNAFKLRSVEIFKKEKNCVAYIRKRMKDSDLEPALSFINFVNEEPDWHVEEEYKKCTSTGKITERLDEITKGKLRPKVKRTGTCLKWYFEHLHERKQPKDMTQLNFSVNRKKKDGEFSQEPGSGFIKVVDDKSTLFLSTIDPSKGVEGPQKMCVKVIDKRYRRSDLSLVKESELSTAFPSHSLQFRSMESKEAISQKKHAAAKSGTLKISLSENQEYLNQISDVKGSRMSPLYAIDKDKVEPEQKFELDEEIIVVVVPEDKTKVTQLTSEHVMDIDQEGYAKKKSITERLDRVKGTWKKQYDNQTKEGRQRFEKWKRFALQSGNEEERQTIQLTEKEKAAGKRIYAKLQMKIVRDKFQDLKETGRMLDEMKSVIENNEEPADAPTESAEASEAQTEVKTKKQDKADGWNAFKDSYTALRDKWNRCWEVRRKIAEDITNIREILEAKKTETKEFREEIEKEREILQALRRDARKLLEQSTTFVKDDDKQQEIKNVLERENELETKEEDEKDSYRAKTAQILDSAKINEQSWPTFLKSFEPFDETEMVKSAFVDVELTQKNLEAVRKAVEKVGGSPRLQTTRTFKIQANDEKGNDISTTAESILKYCNNDPDLKCERVDVESGRRRLIDSFIIKVTENGTFSDKEIKEKMSKLEGQFGVTATEIKKESKVRIMTPPKLEFSEDKLTNLLKNKLADFEEGEEISNMPDPENEKKKNDVSTGTSPGMYFVYIGVPLAVCALIGFLFFCRCCGAKKGAVKNLSIANSARGADYSVSAFESPIIRSTITPEGVRPEENQQCSEEKQQHLDLSRNEGLILQTRDVSLDASEMHHRSSVPSVEVSEDPDPTTSYPTPANVPMPSPTAPSNGVCEADICALEKSNAAEMDEHNLQIGSDSETVPGSMSLSDVEVQNDSEENTSGQSSGEIFSKLDSVIKLAQTNSEMSQRVSNLFQTEEKI